MGDFHQLPPLPGPYAFESKSWGEVVQVSAQLTEVFRQTDSKLIHHLNNIRMGVHDKETVKFFQSLEKPEWDDQKDEKFIKLFVASFSCFPSDHRAILTLLPFFLFTFLRLKWSYKARGRMGKLESIGDPPW